MFLLFLTTGCLVGASRDISAASGDEASLAVAQSLMAVGAPLGVDPGPGNPSSNPESGRRSLLAWRPRVASSSEGGWREK